jgi:hypothetical protein
MDSVRSGPVNNILLQENLFLGPSDTGSKLGLGATHNTKDRKLIDSVVDVVHKDTKNSICFRGIKHAAVFLCTLIIGLLN